MSRPASRASRPSTRGSSRGSSRGSKRRVTSAFDGSLPLSRPETREFESRFLGDGTHKHWRQRELETRLEDRREMTRMIEDDLTKRHKEAIIAASKPGAGGVDREMVRAKHMREVDAVRFAGNVATDADLKAVEDAATGIAPTLRPDSRGTHVTFAPSDAITYAGGDSLPTDASRAVISSRGLSTRPSSHADSRVGSRQLGRRPVRSRGGSRPSSRPRSRADEIPDRFRDIPRNWTMGRPVSPEEGAIMYKIAERGHENLLMTENSMQHLEIMHKIQRLDDTVPDLIERQRTSMATLEAMEKRVKLLRRTVRDKKATAKKIPAEVSVAEELSMQDDDGMATCELCGRLFLKEMVEFHQRTCVPAGDKGRVDDSDSDDAAGGGTGPAGFGNALAPGGRFAGGVKGPKSVIAERGKVQVQATGDVVACNMCGRRYPRARLKRHMVSCAHKQKLAAKLAQAAAEASARRSEEVLPPQAPRGVKATVSTNSSITLTWEPPIFDGGTPIYDYEISFSLVHARRVGKKVIKEYEPQDPRNTSRWILETPVAYTSFVLDRLLGGREYADFRVRAINKAGISDWSAPFPSFETTAVTGPSKVPNFWICGEVTSDTIPLEWAEPMDDGGKPIIGYKVRYTVEVREQVAGKTARHSNIFKKELTRDVGLVLRYDLNELDGNVEHEDIYVVAINNNDPEDPDAKEGERSDSYTVRTKLPDRLQMVRNEIRRTKALKVKYVDTEFFQGFMQRLERTDYIDKLKSEETVLVAEMEARARGEAGPKFRKGQLYSQGKKRRGRRRRRRRRRSDRERDGSSPDGRMHEEGAVDTDLQYQRYLVMKRNQFFHKMKKLNEEIGDIQNEITGLLARRVELTKGMYDADEKLRTFTAELDRARVFKGKFMDTTVLHKFATRFEREALISVLERHCEDNVAYIAASKKEIIEGIYRIEKLQEKRNVSEEYLQDRKAALLAFEKDAEKQQRTTAVVTKLLKKGIKVCFGAWVEFVRMRHGERATVDKIFRRVENRELAGGWYQWKGVIMQEKMLEAAVDAARKDEAVPGRGSAMMQKNGEEADNNVRHARELLQIVGQVDTDLDETALTAAQLRIKDGGLYGQAKMEAEAVLADASKFKDNWAEGGKVDVATASLLRQCDGYLGLRRYDDAERCLDEHEKKAWDAQDRCALTQCYKRRTQHAMAIKDYSKAAVLADRYLQLARRENNRVEEARAFRALGQSMFYQGKHDQAVRYHEEEINVWDFLCDLQGRAAAMRCLAAAHDRMDHESKAKEYEHEAAEIEAEALLAAHRGLDRLQKCEAALVGANLRKSRKVTLELVSAAVPELRFALWDLEMSAKATVAEAKEVHLAIKKAHKLIKDCDTEMGMADKMELKEKKLAAEEAGDTAKVLGKKARVASKLVHQGALANYEITELKGHLAGLRERAIREIAAHERTLRKLATRRKNYEDEAAELRKQGESEVGPLMLSILQKTKFRLIALHPANFSCNDVLGGNTGGVRLCAASKANSVYMFELSTGRCVRAWRGDTHGSHMGHMRGHTGTITSLYLYDDFVFSGSVDMSVRVWDFNPQRKKPKPPRAHRDVGSYLWLRDGHTASVTSIVADRTRILSGSADNKIIAWHPTNGQLLRKIRGHEAAVICMAFSSSNPSQFVSGSVDEEVRVWECEESSTNPVKRVVCIVRLVGHGTHISSVLLSWPQAVSGGTDGSICVWDCEASAILRKMDGHDGAVTRVLADATRIVSGGNDGAVIVHDIASGEKTNTMRGHKGSILDLQFDTQRVLTASQDGTMRQWFWEGKGAIGGRHRQHVLEPGETVRTLAEQYRVKVADIIKWNKITDLRSVYVGQQLIVEWVEDDDSDEDTAEPSTVLSKGTGGGRK